jgi:hypothetical protein
MTSTSDNQGHTDPPVEPAGGNEGKRSISYHQRIVFVSGLLATMGLVFGLALAAGPFTRVKSRLEVKEIFATVCLFSAYGFASGFTVMCLFAPREFLNGAAGQKWMRMIGTKSVLMARVVCLIAIAALVGVGYFAIFGK